MLNIANQDYGSLPSWVDFCAVCYAQMHNHLCAKSGFVGGFFYENVEYGFKISTNIKRYQQRSTNTSTNIDKYHQIYTNISADQ